MFSELKLFQMSSAMARHAGAAQSIVARNIANADTPGFKAQAATSFAETMRASSIHRMAQTRDGHIASARQASFVRAEPGRGEPAPNGNSVDLEQEMVASVEAQRQHSRALSIYKHGLDVLRLSVGRR